MKTQMGMTKSYRKDYPRPQLVRDSWLNLNGNWDFAFDDENIGEEQGFASGFQPQRSIVVPFTYETERSTIHDTARHDHIWYQRTVSLSPAKGRRILLHFEGSDFLTRVWVNGQFAGEHRGGYARFSFDITKLVRNGENRIVVKVEDSFDLSQPRGKQRWLPENYACWYVQTTGIWKTVWLEEVPELYLRALKLTPDMDRGELRIEAVLNRELSGTDGEVFLEAAAGIEGSEVTRSRIRVHGYAASLVLPLENQNMDRFAWGLLRWTPEEPYLYDLECTLSWAGETDRVLSYFGMRDIRIENGNILLNGRPLYQKLILDQGYWKDSGLTPPDEEALIEDIDKIHSLGFNGLRKHMKVEDERFLYWCDVKGMLVWSEMAAAYAFNDRSVTEFTREWMEVVQQNYSHPSIITWTPFNESWGVSRVMYSRPEQHFTEAIYHLTKSLDPMRPVIVNDGWEHTVSDILTLHDYEEFGETFARRYADKDKITQDEVFHNLDKAALAKGYSYKGQPVILSEYGGIAFESRAHAQDWGYGSGVKNETQFLKRYRQITQAIRDIPYIVGYCYTQVCDVEQEVNGLLTPEREFKIAPEKIAAVQKQGL